ncbi:DUF1275 family protein [Streptomyces sp. NPDC001389]|uniref:DUF1275 family protein n=1 Tax=Streptomyces sp. NPDC001389 TaxID=3364569 RepID=UPI0036B39FBB
MPAWVTGLVKAVSLLALGPLFTAMQTGHVLFLSFGLAGCPCRPSRWGRCARPGRRGGAGPGAALVRAPAPTRRAGPSWSGSRSRRPARTGAPRSPPANMEATARARRPHAPVPYPKARLFRILRVRPDPEETA